MPLSYVSPVRPRPHIADDLAENQGPRLCSPDENSIPHPTGRFMSVNILYPMGCKLYGVLFVISI